MRRQIAGICNLHGYYKGEICQECAKETINEAFYTSRDKLWEFSEKDTTGKMLHFTSKRQWYRHLKSMNMHDDMPKDIKEKPFVPTPREEIKKALVERFKETGAWNKLLKKEKRRWL